jgi:hypothetical protein
VSCFGPYSPFAEDKVLTSWEHRYLKTATKLQIEQPKEEEDETEKKGFLGGLLGGKKEDKGKAKSNLSAGEKEAKLGKLLGLGRKK